VIKMARKNLSGSFENDEVTIIGNTPTKTRDVPNKDWVRRTPNNIRPRQRSIFYRLAHNVSFWVFVGLWLTYWIGSMI
jgi:hypothetical protein